jgi:hypothetical protein
VGPSIPPDPALPGAAGLLGASGQAAVERFLSRRGWEALRVQPVSAFYRPGRSLLVRFDTRARQPGGPVEGLTVAADCRADGPVRLWAFPDDPALPGLRAALQPPTDRNCAPGTTPTVVARAQFDQPGVAAEMLRYRPRRRAVLRYHFRRGEGREGAVGPPRTPADRVLFGKVLPPARARRALQATEALSPAAGTGLRLALPAAGPAPGALVVAPVAGRPLRDLLLAGDTLPSPARLARLSDDLAGMHRPTAGRSLPDSPAWPRLARASGAAGLTGHLLPALRPVLDKVVAAVAQGIDSDPADRRPVHGDLYEAQVLVADDDALGLVDLDDVGLGDPLLDAATFSAHLVALALCPGAATPRILAWRSELRRAFLDHLGAHERSLRWRESYAMILLAPGPFRALRPDWPAKVTARVEAATQLLHAH